MAGSGWIPPTYLWYKTGTPGARSHTHYSGIFKSRCSCDLVVLGSILQVDVVTKILNLGNYLATVEGGYVRGPAPRDSLRVCASLSS